MIIDDFVLIDQNGLYCKYGDFYLDPIQPVKTAVISHAHADHAVSGNNNVYCTAGTRALMELRYSRYAAKVLSVISTSAFTHSIGSQVASGCNL